jgi:hypothetical protein
MTFSSRQYEELYGYIEVSFTAAVSPAAVGANANVGVGGVNCTLNGGQPATIALGDLLDVIPLAAAATNGIIVSAAPSATPGQIAMQFYNPTGGTITPTTQVYKIIARRVRPDLID